MRIGIVVDGLYERSTADGSVRIANGGVGVYIANLVAALLEVDRENRYVLLRCGEGRLPIYEDRRLTCAFARPSLVNRYGRWLDLPYRRPSRDLELDLVHHPNQFGGLMLPSTLPQVVTLHDLSPLLFPHLHRWKTRLRFGALLRPSLRRANAVIVDAERTRREVIARRLADPERVSVVPLGVARSFQPATGAGSADPFVLTVGVLEPRKNLDVLCDAVRRLRARGRDLRLVVVGRKGWHWKDPRADAPFVRVIEDASDDQLRELYGRAAAFAYPSLYEGFGLPVLEAMACGTPVVVSRTACPEELTAGAALTADPSSAEDFAAKIARVLDDGAMRDRLVRAGSERARRFTWRRTAEATLDVYRRAVRDAGLTPTAPPPSRRVALAVEP